VGKTLVHIAISPGLWPELAKVTTFVGSILRAFASVLRRKGEDVEGGDCGVAAQRKAKNLRRG